MYIKFQVFWSDCFYQNIFLFIIRSFVLNSNLIGAQSYTRNHISYLIQLKLKHTEHHVWANVKNVLLRNKRFKSQKRRIVFRVLKYFLCISWRIFSLQNKMVQSNASLIMYNSQSSIFSQNAVFMKYYLFKI